MDNVLIAPGVALVDISASLPRHKTLRYRIRVNEPEALIVHHSASDRVTRLDPHHDDPRIFEMMAQNHITPRDGAPLGWPGIAYHTGIARVPDRDSAGNLITCKLAPESTIRYHSGGRANLRCSALVLQGHLGLYPLTPEQEICTSAYLEYWLAEHPGGVIGWHAIASRWGGRDKRACPGRYAVEWLRAWLTARGLPADPGHLV